MKKKKWSFVGKESQSILQYGIVPYCTVLQYHIVLYFIVRYRTVRYRYHYGILNDPYRTVPYRTNIQSYVLTYISMRRTANVQEDWIRHFKVYYTWCLDGIRRKNCGFRWL